MDFAIEVWRDRRFDIRTKFNYVSAEFLVTTQQLTNSSNVKASFCGDPMEEKFY
jgi:hypothetical protein